MKRYPIVVFALAATILFVSAPVHAFCGFYVGGAGAKMFNNATQVVLMREGTRTVLSMANNYQGPAKDFAMVVPVPVVLQKQNVKTLTPSIFDHVDQLTSPRLVEYWEQDPCPKWRDDYESASGVGSVLRSAPSKAEAADAPARPKVRIEAKFTVGEYDIVILSADDSVALYEWLKQNKYNIPDGAEKVLQPYIASNMKFFVAKVDIEKVKIDGEGRTMLSPLRFHYDSETFSLPIRLGLLNSAGTQDLIVHILARNQRYEVANYKNITIPTNIYIRAAAKARFGELYASLFDQVTRKNPGAVVTEYAWDASTCDPCPGPAIQPDEINTLGADVVFQNSTDGNQLWGWTITRLHARYTKDSLGEDLVFRAAPPITGGREVRPNGRKLERGATSSSVNNFQGRYIIRYKWTGPVTCKNPRWGVWGGPPGNQIASGGVETPRNLAFVKNRRLPLPSYVLQRIPEIDVSPTSSKPKSSTSPKNP